MAPALVLDIEGTTTPIAFVYDVLFPYARRRLRPYLDDPKNEPALREPLRRLREEWEYRGPAEAGPYRHIDNGPSRDQYVALEYIEMLMDQDRKSPGLKMLQGLIWEGGYRSGELRGEIFGDVAPALRRWREAGTVVAIYSSGSELAQRLLFGSTPSGDLTPLIARFFDTAVGAKSDAGSYRRIARELRREPGDVLFVSDMTAELDAASAAGCQVRLCVRPGNQPQPPHRYHAIASFDEMQ